MIGGQVEGNALLHTPKSPQPLVCVECGEYVSSLFVEFSEGSIKLTRCSKCGNCADKYIEYELSIVLIDVVLHRRPAFRHLYYNRRDFWTSSKSIRWVAFLILGMDAAFKAIVLHKTLYLSVSGSFQATHVASLSLLEHIAFLTAFCLVLLASSRSRRIVLNLLRFDRRKMYLALSLPECAKFVSIVLQIFDQDPSLILLLALLTASVQHTSFHTLAGSQLSVVQVAIALLAALGARFCVRCCFYSIEDVQTLGWIA